MPRKAKKDEAKEWLILGSVSIGIGIAGYLVGKKIVEDIKTKAVENQIQGNATSAEAIAFELWQGFNPGWGSFEGLADEEKIFATARKIHQLGGRPFLAEVSRKYPNLAVNVDRIQLSEELTAPQLYNDEVARFYAIVDGTMSGVAVRRKATLLCIAPCKARNFDGKMVSALLPGQTTVTSILPDSQNRFKLLEKSGEMFIITKAGIVPFKNFIFV